MLIHAAHCARELTWPVQKFFGACDQRLAPVSQPSIASATEGFVYETLPHRIPADDTCNLPGAARVLPSFVRQAWNKGVPQMAE